MSKKLCMLISAVFLLAGIAAAQNSATSTQSGNTNEAVITQTTSNTATTSQTGDNGKITITQTGTNIADVTQVETAASTPVGQQISTVTQTGANNSATVHQTETGGGGHGTNRAIVNQNGSDNGVSQTTYAPGSNSGQGAEAYQVGDRNQATQNITSGYTNSFKSEQYGDENTVNQTMGASHSHGKVLQDGDRNDASQTISGSNHGYSGGINIKQYQDDNTATQTFSGGGLGHVQRGDITQDGLYNNASQTAAGNDNTAWTMQTGDDNTATTTMTGNDNTGRVDQTGTNNSATVNQTGNNHNADVDQYGSNYADVQQDGGNRNSAVVEMGTAAAPITSRHQPNYSGDHMHGVWIDQTGSDNIAESRMFGSKSSAAIYQTGDENEGYQSIGTFASGSTSNKPKMAVQIDQVGNLNDAFQTTVSGFGCFGIQAMHAEQTGNSNSAVQYSRGGMASTMSIKQAGSNNTSAVSADVAGTGMASPLDLAWAHDAAAIGSGGYTQYQNGRYSNAVIDVTGSSNKTTQVQQYTVHAVSGVNSASMTVNGDGNAAIQGQLGENNQATMTVAGSDNILTAGQAGDLNVSTISLIGASSNNIAVTSQTGNSHSAVISITGGSNTATIMQQ